MITFWLLYALLVGALLAGAAWALEGVLRLRAIPVRWVWLGALVLTLVLIGTAPLRVAPAPTGPTVDVLQPLLHSPAPAEPGSAAPFATVLASLRGVVAAPLHHAAGALQDAPLRRVDEVVAAAWVLLSALLLLAFSASLRRYRRTRRRWPVAQLHGTQVRIAPAAGPAVVGWLRPEIVVPRWLLGSTPEEQRLVIAHEREHLAAGDHRLLAAGCLVAVLLPWHPAVWWMLRRLHLAVELDCDARVLRQGVSPLSYGSLLIDIAGRSSGLPVGAPALADTPSHLERRLLAMNTVRSRFLLARGAALGVVALASVLAACETSLPTAAQIDEMDVAGAERQAQRIAFIRAGDGEDVVFVVDGVAVSAEEARALPADRIGQIKVLRKTGEASQIHISTAEEGAPRTERVERILVNPEAGEGTRVQVRVARGEGTTAVLGGEAQEFQGVVIIDGNRADASALRTLKPDQIQGIEVIKGAAATKLYNFPGAENGVIRITTKRGSTPQ